MAPRKCCVRTRQRHHRARADVFDLRSDNPLDLGCQFDHRTAPPASDDFVVDLDASRPLPSRRRRGRSSMPTPNNPTGHVMGSGLESKGSLRSPGSTTCGWSLTRSISNSTFELPHLSIAGLPGMAERTATVSSLSKSHAMTGWRSGWVIGPTQLIGPRLQSGTCHALWPARLHPGGGPCRTSPRSTAAKPARCATSTAAAAISWVRGLAGINSISCKAPQGGMFMMIDTRHSGLSAYDFTWRLFRETGVAVLDASPRPTTPRASSECRSATATPN